MKIARDTYQTVTDKIVAALEAGVRPWTRSWSVGTGVSQAFRPLRSSGAPYKGVNVLILALSGRAGRYWFTYRQAQELGAQVRGGEEGTKVVFYKKLLVQDRDNADKTKSIPLLREYTVFNQDQIDGLPARFDAPAPVAVAPLERNVRVEVAFAQTGAEVRHGGDRAYYVPSLDFIQMPQAARFNSTESYYATLAHELTHWTGHTSRLDRKFPTEHGNKDHAREELVAEIGAAFICAGLDLSAEPRADHAQYLAEWLSVLREDKKAIFQAAAAAQKAADLVLGFSAEEEETPMQEAA